MVWEENHPKNNILLKEKKSVKIRDNLWDVCLDGRLGRIQ